MSGIEKSCHSSPLPSRHPNTKKTSYVILSSIPFLLSDSPSEATHDRGRVLGVQHLTVHLGIIDDHRMQGARQDEDDKDAHGSCFRED